MTHIKLCGLSRVCDIEAANILMPEYVGFVLCNKGELSLIHHGHKDRWTL